MISMELRELLIRGFFMSILGLGDIITSYAFTTIVNILPGATPIKIPGYLIVPVAVGLIFLFMTIAGYFQDFEKGWEFPKQALVYAISAAVGLYFFWPHLLAMYPQSIGIDSITSTIATIIILVLAACLHIYSNRNKVRLYDPNYKSPL
jgi:hypothetical protein